MDIALERRPEPTLFKYKTKQLAHAVRQACYQYRGALLNELREARRREMESIAPATEKLFAHSEDDPGIDMNEVQIEMELAELSTPYHDLYLKEPYEKDGLWILRMSFDNPRLPGALVGIEDEEGNAIKR